MPFLCCLWQMVAQPIWGWGGEPHGNDGTHRGVAKAWAAGTQAESLLMKSGGGGAAGDLKGAVTRGHFNLRD